MSRATSSTRPLCGSTELGISNCDLVVQDVYQRDEAATFDVVAVTGSISAYDPRFEQWLNPGGRAFVVIGAPPAMEACLITRQVEGPAQVESLFETVVPPLRVPGNAGTCAVPLLTPAIRNARVGAGARFRLT